MAPKLVSANGRPLDVPSGDVVFGFEDNGHMQIHVGEKPMAFQNWAMIAAYAQFMAASLLGTQQMMAGMNAEQIAAMQRELAGGQN